MPTTDTGRWRRTALPLAAMLVLAAVAAACGGTTAPPSLAPATPAPTPEAVATPAATSQPTPAPYAFASSAYGYEVVLPGASVAEQALRPWDGETRIDSSGPFVDQVRLPGSILFFVYGAPTDLALEDYGARTQQQMVDWHACPAEPETTRDLELDGTMGRLYGMTCQGLHVQKLMLVRDGQGLVVNMLAPPDAADDADQLLEDLVATMVWPA